jgi:Fur family transcriptional regulator, peroxide stress response regulator
MSLFRGMGIGIYQQLFGCANTVLTKLSSALQNQAYIKKFSTNSNYSYIVLNMNKRVVDINETFRSKCREANLKITPQRSLIFDELSKATDHPTVDGIYKRVRKTLSNISFDTVYRTLLSFTKIGIVNLVEGTGEQKRFEPNLHQHHHFRCIKCYTIYDFENDANNDIAVPEAVQKQGVIINKRVVLEGICSKCKEK